jgi:alpha-D-ribose 1-methylphosphonate 5-triphosphate synthase subunit PhnL
MKILEISGLTKEFFLYEQGIVIRGCRDIALSLPAGGFTGIVGRSGSGKSTILRCVYRTYLPTAGRILYRSERYGQIDLARASEREILHLRQYEIGYVSQFLSIMPRTTARDHVEQAVLETGRDGARARAGAQEMLAYFKLPEKLWDIYPNTFSGGERLRLNLAHAMVKEPRLLLLDEPTASLDNETKLLVRNLLLEMKGRGASIMGIFHDLEFIEGVCDDVYNMNLGQLTAKGM